MDNYLRYLAKVTRQIPLPGRYMRRIISYFAQLNTIEEKELIFIPFLNGYMYIYDNSEFIQRDLYYLGYFEYWESKNLIKILKPGDIFIDIGSNIGWYTCLASNYVGNKGHVISFEPNKMIHERLKENIAINNKNNITIYNTALSNVTGESFLLRANKNNIGTSKITNSKDGNIEKISTITFDDFYNERLCNIKIAAIKIDVEGHEMEVILGMQKTLEQNKITNIIVEVNDYLLREKGYSVTELIKFFTANDYEIVNASTGKKIINYEKIKYANLLFRKTYNYK